LFLVIPGEPTRETRDPEFHMQPWVPALRYASAGMTIVACCAALLDGRLSRIFQSAKRCGKALNFGLKLGLALLRLLNGFFFRPLHELRI
jgi:hypothetical protein